MKLDLSLHEFVNLGSNKQKEYVARLLIKSSGAKPVEEDLPPVAFVMAGIPGAGKTEFLDSVVDELDEIRQVQQFVRIDLDEIVTVFPGYTPKTNAKFRSQGTNVLARTIDVCRHGRYNMMIDGTFSGQSGASINNIQRLLETGYEVVLIFMFDKPETAWSYTVDREKLTDRGIGRDEFIQSCKNLSANLLKARELFSGNKNFTMKVVKQKVLRDKNYEYVTDSQEIDNIIKQGYDIAKVKELI